ncbi:hypothetical protein [Candidatus Neptunichlamydia sp. REUL1]|uniref:hypothetical protein n=1 Tax=Candidatus Neptunichlamydia sp. REUL1 TaxID=3064277 RepID=UPI00292F1376|nr:hypothetical protein [Candidatus Neptunochlamydia sp. REUL1]
MTVNFNHYFKESKVTGALKEKEAALLEGAVIEYQDKRYHFQILPTTTETRLKTRLIFQAYTETRHEIRYYDKGESKAGFIGGSRFGNGAIPIGTRFFEVIIKGNIIKEAEEIIFKGNLQEAETTFYAAHEGLPAPKKAVEEEEEVIIPPVTTTAWTRPQKASLLVAAVLATMTITYGAKKMVNHYDLKAPKMPTLEDLKASLDKLRNWRKGAAAA